MTKKKTTYFLAKRSFLCFDWTLHDNNKMYTHCKNKKKVVVLLYVVQKTVLDYLTHSCNKHFKRQKSTTSHKMFLMYITVEIQLLLILWRNDGAFHWMFFLYKTTSKQLLLTQFLWLFNVDCILSIDVHFTLYHEMQTLA